MIPTRVIPVLLLRGEGLVKTVRFAAPAYLGDPRNTVRIFNEREVDELVLLDITATARGTGPRLDLLREIVDEAFMPLAYGGGIRTPDEARAVLALGVEKVVLSTHAVRDPALVGACADAFGSSSVVVCLDVRRSLLGRYEVVVANGTERTRQRPADLAAEMVRRGAGEIVVQSVDRDGAMGGYDVALVRSVADAVPVPVVALGGAGSLADLAAAVAEGGASAVAAGSLFVFHGRHRAVLVNYPDAPVLRALLPSGHPPRLPPTGPLAGLASSP